MPDDDVRTEEIEEEDEWGGEPEAESPAEAEGADSASGGKRRLAILALLVALLIAAGAGYWFTYGPGKPPEPPPPFVEVEPEPVVEEEPEPELPSVDASDPFLRALFAAISANPDVLAWLLGDDLARRIAVAVDNVADGISPRRALSPLAPSDGFSALGEGEELHIAPASFARYDSVATAVEGADSPGMARVIREALPILDAAYAELGRPDRTFAEALLTALDRLAAVAVPEMPVLLNERVMRHDYRDPAFEGLDNASKHLLRFGPENQGQGPAGMPQPCRSAPRRRGPLLTTVRRPPLR